MKKNVIDHQEFKQELFKHVLQHLEKNEHLYFVITELIAKEMTEFYATKLKINCSSFYNDFEDKDFQLIFGQSKGAVELSYIGKYSQLISSKMFEQFLTVLYQCKPTDTL